MSKAKIERDDRDALRNLVPIVEFKKQHWVFSRFLNCTNGTKLRNASQFINPFFMNLFILHPLKTRETFVFLVFSGGVKWEDWCETGLRCHRSELSRVFSDSLLQMCSGK